MIDISHNSKFLWYLRATVSAVAFILLLIGILTQREPNNYELQEAIAAGLIVFIPILIILAKMNSLRRNEPANPTRNHYLLNAFLYALLASCVAGEMYFRHDSNLYWAFLKISVIALLFFVCISNLKTFFTFKKEEQCLTQSSSL